MGFVFIIGFEPIIFPYIYEQNNISFYTGWSHPHPLGYSCIYKLTTYHYLSSINRVSISFRTSSTSPYAIMTPYWWFRVDILVDDWDSNPHQYQ